MTDLSSRFERSRKTLCYTVNLKPTSKKNADRDSLLDEKYSVYLLFCRRTIALCFPNVTEFESKRHDEEKTYSARG